MLTTIHIRSTFLFPQSSKQTRPIQEKHHSPRKQPTAGKDPDIKNSTI